MFATLAGAYPWPTDLSPEAALDAVVAAQARAGLGLLSDGRVHDASTPGAELVAAWAATRAAAAVHGPDLPVKLAVEGPWTRAAGETEGGAPAPGGAAAQEIVALLREGLAQLADAGCPVVEIHEAAAALPANETGRAAFAAVHGALLAGFPEHLHACLAITGGDATPLGAEALFAAPYRSHLFDLVAGPDSWRLVAVAPRERGIVAGVGDASGRHRTRLEDLVWAASYAASTQGRGIDRVGIAPSASLAGLDPAAARAIVDLLGEAARTIAGGREEVVERLDPRAIDARSAALGHYRPARSSDPAER
jgi:methionine synthase II (cobalamin-independent)